MQTHLNFIYILICFNLKKNSKNTFNYFYFLNYFNFKNLLFHCEQNKIK